jgi:hypothetical protein
MSRTKEVDNVIINWEYSAWRQKSELHFADFEMHAYIENIKFKWNFRLKPRFGRKSD